MLLIIGLVTSDTDTTREMCAKALYNLLHYSDGHAIMVERGVLHGFSTMSKIQNTDILQLCATAFCNLSRDYFKEIVISSVRCTSLPH